MSEEIKDELLNKKHFLLDKGWIELQDMMGDDLAIVNAARVSFLGESKGDKADKKLLFYLMKHRHTSPFEQVEFKFRVRAPLIVFWHWVRHRTWNFNAQSGRYTEFKEDDFYIPESGKWRLQAKDNKQASDGLLPKIDKFTDGNIVYGGHSFTTALIDYCNQGYELYKQALRCDVAREQARLFLPAFGVYYTWVCKVDAHNLMNFLGLRLGNDSQYETRVYADVIFNKFFKPSLPWTAEAFEKYRLGGE
jgi:thymidylate synthase (FAD)